MLRHDEDPAGANGGAFGKQTLAGDAPKDTRDTLNRQPLVIEAGAVRTATLAELRRIARMGMIGGAV